MRNFSRPFSADVALKNETPAEVRRMTDPTNVVIQGRLLPC